MSERKLFPIAATVAELSKLTGWHRSVFYTWIAAGLPRYRVGVRKVLLVADVVEFIRANCERVKP
jgi:hypothetical protein